MNVQNKGNFILKYYNAFISCAFQVKLVLFVSECLILKPATNDLGKLQLSVRYILLILNFQYEFCLLFIVDFVSGEYWKYFVYSEHPGLSVSNRYAFNLEIEIE